LPIGRLGEIEDVMAMPLDVPSVAPLSAKLAPRYRAICAPAVISVVLGGLSILTALHWSLALIPLAGIVLGWSAHRRIRAAPDEWTGLGLARLGIGLSAALWVVGYGVLWVRQTVEVPWGYEAVRNDWEKLQPDPRNPVEVIPESATALNEKKVYIKGYMQPRRQQQGIKEFILCPANGECPFCVPNPRPTQKVRIVLQGDMETIYTNRLIGVGGKFLVEPSDPSGIPYGMECDYLR
jgi:hypothetical protein